MILPAKVFYLISMVFCVITIEELLKINGVVAAGEFTTDGKLKDYKTNNMPMSQEMAIMTAQFCASVTMLFNTLAGGFTQLSKMPWTPQKVWTYSGGDYTVAINGNNTGVFAETAKVNFDELVKALMK